MEANKPAEVRGQTQDEIRIRLRKQGKLKSPAKKTDDGVSQLSEDDVRIIAAKRAERIEEEQNTPNPKVRIMTKKDVALRLSASLKRKATETEEPLKVLTEEAIKKRNKDNDDDDKIEDGIEDEETPEPGPEPKPESKIEKDDEVEIFAKDIVTFKDEDGTIVTGKVLKVNSKGEATIDTEEATYTVSCDELTKVVEEEN